MSDPIVLKPKGDPKAKIVVISGWPLPEDGRKGELWGGSCGRILENVMTRAGIAPSSCYFTSIIKSPIRNQKYNAFFKEGRNRYKFTEIGEVHLKAFLEKELPKTDPIIYILVGNLALNVMTENWGASKFRGSVLSTINNKKAIATIGVMSTVIDFSLRGILSFDIIRASKEYKKGGRIERTPRNNQLFPTLEEAIEFLQVCKNSKRVACDIEIDGTEVSCISFSYVKETQDIRDDKLLYEPSNHAISIPFWDYEKFSCYYSLEAEHEIWVHIASVLEDPKVEIIYQNAAFDASYLFNKYHIVTTNIQDTMIAAGIIAPEYSKSLGFLTTFYTDMPYYKDEGKEAILASGKRIKVAVSNEKFFLYNAKDSVVLPEILYKQFEDLRSIKNLDAYKAQRDIIYPILYMQSKGMKVSTELMQLSLVEARKQIEEYTKEIHSIVGYEINIKSPKQLKKYFYEELNFNLRKDRKTGKPTVNEKALKQWAKKGNVVASLILKARKQAKLASTYYDMKLDEDKRIRCSFNPVGTKSGRLSSRKLSLGQEVICRIFLKICVNTLFQTITSWAMRLTYLKQRIE